MSCRQDNLSFEHHKQVAKLDTENQKEFLQKAVDEKLSVRELRSEIKKSKFGESPKLPDGKFNVIYADPPWQYENSGFINSAESNYPTMPILEICNMPIKDLTTNESVLFLWATNPLLPEALQVMDAWGFIYKTNFVWIKDKARGWAWWAKSKHESLLVGVKKNTGTPETNFDSAFFEKRENKHSKKPEYVYEMIQTMFPSNQKGYGLELFNRGGAYSDYWDVFGNQI